MKYPRVLVLIFSLLATCSLFAQESDEPMDYNDTNIETAPPPTIEEDVPPPPNLGEDSYDSDSESEY